MFSAGVAPSGTRRTSVAARQTHAHAALPERSPPGDLQTILTARHTNARSRGLNLLHLQRTCGNAVVSRLVAQAHAHIQRCGPVACDCSDEERAAHDAGDVQRVVQRDDRQRPAQVDKPEPGKLKTLVHRMNRVPLITGSISNDKAVLTYRGKQRVILSASTDALRLMKGDLASRPPFAYDFTPVPEEHLADSVGVAPRYYPIIRLAVGPGVGIAFENWPDSPFFDLDHPMVEIFRVQNPADLPPPEGPINPNSLPSSKPVDPAREKGKTALAQMISRVLTIPRADGVDFIYYDPNPKHSSHAGEMFSVTAPNLLGTTRFAYEVVPPKPGEIWPWTIKVVKTPSVKIKSAGVHEGGWSMLLEEVYEVDSVVDVPSQGSAIKPTGRQVRSWEADVIHEPNWFGLIFDTVVSFIPIVGDLYMLAEFQYGVATGHDFWGQPLSKTDLAILGAAALLPYAGGAVRLAKTLAQSVKGLENAEKLARAAAAITEAERAAIKAQEALIRGGKAISKVERAAMVETLRALDASAEKATARAAEVLSGREAALARKYGDDARKVFKNLGSDAEYVTDQQIGNFLKFYKGLNPESRAIFEANPRMRRTYMEMDPATRKLFMLCASPCPANALPEQVARVKAVMAKNGVQDGSNAFEGMRQFLHRHGATTEELERAIVAAERSENLAELSVIITKRPDAETLRIGQTYAQELAANKGLNTRFDRIQTAIRDAGRISDPAERAEALRKAGEDLRNLERQLSERGVVSGGTRFKPEASRAGENRELLGDGIHGVDWPDAQMIERIRSGGPQGRFGSVADVTYAVQQGAALGTGRMANIRVPPGNTSRIYSLDASGRLVSQNPNSYYIKTFADGRVHAYPSLDPPTR